MLYLHRSSRADYLVDTLGDVLIQPLPDPMASEVVAVPTRGVERWLTQRLSNRLGARPGAGDGISANINFPFPGTLIAKAMAAVDIAGTSGGDNDPWSPERSVWPLLQLVDEHLGDPLMRPLAAHLRASSPTAGDDIPRRFTAVRHLADLYDRYAVHRPGMLLAWERGPMNTLSSPRPEDMAWQAELWRLLRHRLGGPSPAERLETAPPRIEAQPSLLDLPARILVVRPHPPAHQSSQGVESYCRAPRRAPVPASSIRRVMGPGCGPGAAPAGRVAQTRRPDRAVA